jgi:hypothetical protein
MSAILNLVAMAILLVSGLCGAAAAQSCQQCSIVDVQKAIDCFLGGATVGVCPGGTNCPSPAFEQAFDSGGFLNGCQSRQFDVSRAKAVGASLAPDLRMRMSGIRVDGVSYVADLKWQGDTGAHLVPGSITQSAPPTISDLQCTGGRNATGCGASAPDKVIFKMKFVDPNADLVGGRFNYNFTNTLRTSGNTLTYFGNIEFLPYQQTLAATSCDTPSCTSGTITLNRCWSGFSHFVFDVSFTDADEQRSNTLSCTVDIP